MKEISALPFAAAQFTITKIWNQCKCPSVDAQIKTKLVYMHNGILLGHKKDEIQTFATKQMHLEVISLSEINQTQKDKTLCFLSYVEVDV